MNTIASRWAATAMLIFIASTVFAQAPSGEVQRDNFYDRNLSKERQAKGYDYINERDVTQEKRIWRVISVDEKRNHHFKYDKAPFVNILLDAAKKGEITIYGTMDDEFKTPLTCAEASKLGTKSDTTVVYNFDTNLDTTIVVNNAFNPSTVKKYRIKEVFYFDKESGKMSVRILGIAPIVQRFDADGNFLNEGPLFWAYYPQAREVLARHEVFNTENDATNMSWEDVFEARLFSSYVTKESNVYDRRIQDYAAGERALIEGRNIELDLQNKEHDNWEY
jgi:gliding motility associated protien GldN